MRPDVSRLGLAGVDEVDDEVENFEAVSWTRPLFSFLILTMLDRPHCGALSSLLRLWKKVAPSTQLSVLVSTSGKSSGSAGRTGLGLSGAVKTGAFAFSSSEVFLSVLSPVFLGLSVMLS